MQRDGRPWWSLGPEPSAFFAATSHEQGAVLAERVLADLTPDERPDLDVRGEGVRVRLARGSDRRTAGVITGAAADLGLTADPAGLQRLEVHLSGPNPAALAPFWQAVLSYDGPGRSATGVDVAVRAEGGGDVDRPAFVLSDSWRRRPTVHLGIDSRPRPLRSRVHLDSGWPTPIGPVVTSAEAAAGRVRYASEWYSTLADPDGNEVDVVPGGPWGDGATADWSLLFAAVAAYPVPDPATAANLAGTAARAADAAGIPLLIDLRPGRVVLDSGKDQWEEVAGFADLAAEIQAAARALGLSPDNADTRFLQVGIDAVDVPAVRAFWRAALDYVPAPNTGITDLFDPRHGHPVVFFQPMDPAETDRRAQEDRISLSLTLPEPAFELRLAAAAAAGGTVVMRSAGQVLLADPEGNRLRLVAAQPAT